MEFLLLPHDRGEPPLPVPKTPYVAGKVRYDGGPFLSYPARVGKPHFGTCYLDRKAYMLAERANPTPIEDLQAFIQTWLFFGFVAEYLDANSEDALDPNSDSPNEILDYLYKKHVVQKDGKAYVVVDADGLQAFVAKTRPSKDLPARILRLKHLTEVMTCVSAVWDTLPAEFNHAVKYAIGAVGEVFSSALQHFINSDTEQTWGFATGYIDQDVRSLMISRGWCPSDVARAQNNFSSLQVLYIARMMDRSSPKQDHSSCTERACYVCQINIGEYKLKHTQECDGCGLLSVDPKALTKVLKNGQIPLLRLIGELDNLRAEIVPYELGTRNAPFIAISHVWADGLGNPFENALHRCKLTQVQEFITTIYTSPSGTGPGPVLWIDTLCCPAQEGEGKQLAIQTLPLVYRSSTHTLVLDSTLMSYPSHPQETPEKLIRIFSSPWMRRVWTLQEGALSKSLYFQFSDEAVSLDMLKRSIKEAQRVSMRDKNIWGSLSKNFRRLQGFFLKDKDSTEAKISKIALLDQALLYRSVSVASDEALCIGTLMSLDMAAILKVEPKENRMQKVWELLAASEEGISSEVIFFEGGKIEAPGWRWAPRSLLSPEESILASNLRLVRWEAKNRGTTCSGRGFRVQYPGYRITTNAFKGRKLRNPWPGINRVAESAIHFRDISSGQWYAIGDKKYVVKQKGFKTEEERLAYQKLELFPLRDIANNGQAVLLLNFNPSHGLASDGIFGTAVDKKGGGDCGEGIVLRGEIQAFVWKLEPDEAHIYETMDRLASELKENKITATHIKLYEQLKKDCNEDETVLKERMKEDEAFKTSVENVKCMFKDSIAKVARGDERFTAAVDMHIQKGLLEYVWIMIPERMNNDYFGAALKDNQVWFVD